MEAAKASHCCVVEMSLEHMLRDEEELLALFLGEEFEMAVVIETVRIIFRCQCRCQGMNRRCGTSWAHDYQRNAQGQLFRTWEAAPEDANQEPISFPEYDLYCPTCHHKGMVKVSEVIGNVTSKPCNERCTESTKSVCNCSCGGANHGKAHLC